MVLLSHFCLALISPSFDSRSKAIEYRLHAYRLQMQEDKQINTQQHDPECSYSHGELGDQ